MSIRIAEQATQRGSLQYTRFAGPNGRPMLQLSQGLGMGVDQPGFIQLTQEEVGEVIEVLKLFQAE